MCWKTKIYRLLVSLFYNFFMRAHSLTFIVCWHCFHCLFSEATNERKAITHQHETYNLFWLFLIVISYNLRVFFYDVESCLWDNWYNYFNVHYASFFSFHYWYLKGVEKWNVAKSIIIVPYFLLTQMIKMPWRYLDHPHTLPRWFDWQ